MSYYIYSNSFDINDKWEQGIFIIWLRGEGYIEIPPPLYHYDVTSQATFNLERPTFNLTTNEMEGAPQITLKQPRSFSVASIFVVQKLFVDTFGLQTLFNI